MGMGPHSSLGDAAEAAQQRFIASLILRNTASLRAIQAPMSVTTLGFLEDCHALETFRARDVPACDLAPSVDASALLTRLLTPKNFPCLTDFGAGSAW